MSVLSNVFKSPEMKLVAFMDKKEPMTIADIVSQFTIPEFPTEKIERMIYSCIDVGMLSVVSDQKIVLSQTITNLLNDIGKHSCIR